MVYFAIFFQDAPAETTNYLIMGYTLIFGVLAIYLISLYIRRRNLQRDEELLLELEADELEISGENTHPSSSTVSSAS